MTNSKSPRNSNNRPATDPIQTLGKLSSVVSFGLFVIILIKYVDGRYSRESESAMQQTLAFQEEENQRKLIQYESDSKELLAELERFEEDTISFSELEKVQDEFLLLATKYGCTLKKASPNEKQTVPFLLGSRSSFDATASTSTQPNEEAEFETPRCGLVLSLSGDLGSVMAFVKAVREKSWITSTSQLSLRRDSSVAGIMSLEMELTFLCLQRKLSAEQQASSLPRT